MADDHALLLGEIKGKLDLVITNQQIQGRQLSGLDTRLRKVESKAAVGGALMGALVSVGVELIADPIKRHIGL